MGKVMVKAEKKAEEPVKAEPAPVVSKPEIVNDNMDDQVLAAVIAAAVAAYEGSSSASNLVVKKITRISGHSSPWSVSAKEDCIASRKF
jgi:hypothetical protein